MIFDIPPSSDMSQPFCPKECVLVHCAGVMWWGKSPEGDTVFIFDSTQSNCRDQGLTVPESSQAGTVLRDT